MSADADGNNIDAVSVPVTGFAAVQLSGTPTFVSSAVGGASTLVLPTGYQKVGLFKTDGGPKDSNDKSDDIEFFQDGYTISGTHTRTVEIGLAQFDAYVRQLVSGVAPDSNGMIVITDQNNDDTFPLFTTVKYKNGNSRRRNGLARISAVDADQEKRGDASGLSVTFKWVYTDAIGGLYREWLVTPSGLTVSSVAVSGLATVVHGSTISLTATATYSDSSTADVTSAATWVSSNTSIATVSAAGVVTGVAAGTATITATSGGVSSTAKTITVS